ncbi:hypothetical protein SSS_01508 [Sarcoptes scabiei]|uniref:Uncharacterized protein n=1 Tax=Sarcoptes scabiei TaxID=52283 RepID=A0A834VBK7_SARSC|nr:hypothetical protein SSS_01508 [Sarcoptes scabiei]
MVLINVKHYGYKRVKERKTLQQQTTLVLPTSNLIQSDPREFDKKQDFYLSLVGTFQHLLRCHYDLQHRHNRHFLIAICSLLSCCLLRPKSSQTCDARSIDQSINTTSIVVKKDIDEIADCLQRSKRSKDI